MSRTRLRGFLPVLVLTAAIGLGWLIGAQSDHDMDSGHDMHEPAAAARDDSDVERGFLAAMVPHHQSGIDMADIALDHAAAAEIKRLARAIRDTQGDEIERMELIHRRLFDAPLKPDEDAHAALGLTMEEAGMGHDEAMMRELASARPFDRAFVDEMVPHHEGAIAMAKVLLERTDDAELKQLGQAIIDAQQREIAAMNDFRTKEYGGPVPDEKPSGGGGHGGMGMEGE